MRNHIEKIFRPVVEEFVGTHLAGRYRDHCSDTFLTEVLMMELDGEFYISEDISTTFAEYSLENDSKSRLDRLNVLYIVGSTIFERILERHCSVPDGYQVAQRFADWTFERIQRYTVNSRVEEVLKCIEEQPHPAVQIFVIKNPRDPGKSEIFGFPVVKDAVAYNRDKIRGLLLDGHYIIHEVFGREWLEGTGI